MENLSKESFNFEKNSKPVDIALISFLDQNCKFSPQDVLSNVKINCKNIHNLPPSESRKIDGYYLPSSPALYQPENAEFVNFITKSIAEASVDAHQAENFIFYEQHDYEDRKYFYDQLKKEIDAKNIEKASSVMYHFARVDKLSINHIPEEAEAIIFICIDPNLIDQALAKIVSSYNLRKYQVIGLPGGGYNLIRPETKEVLTQYVKSNPSARVIICSHGAAPDQKEDECYNCGGYQIFEKITGDVAYNQARKDMLQAKEDLKNEGIANIDTVINVATHIGQGKTKGSKLYRAKFEIV